MKRLLNGKRFVFPVIAIILSVSLALGSGCGPEDDTVTEQPVQEQPEENQPRELTDDWNERTDIEVDGKSAPTTIPSVTVAPTAVPAPMPVPEPAPIVVGQAPSASESIGLSAGGAKDINNFRENIENGYMPLPTDVTYEGLFYDYYFDTGQQGECDKLFCPSYSYAVTRDPFSGETDYYLSVGLNSGMKESDFQRKKLNLVVVLDVSGSMDSPFDQYYYDRFGRVTEIPGEGAGKLKISLATESVVAMLDHLGDDDRFGMVLFNNSAHLAKPLNPVGETDMEAIKGHILDIEANGGTQLSAGMQMASDMFDELTDVDPDEYENRIIFLTDAMPNMGDTSRQGLLGMTENNAGLGVYSSFIGIGVDFNSELIEYITKIRGANYYSVHHAREFRERMDDEFDFMVTPLVFDLQLTLEADGWDIEQVYGSPEANEATGELMKVNTLFPSKRQEGETRGGLVLLKLKRTAHSGGWLKLRASYEDRNGRPDSSDAYIQLDAGSPEYFANSGIRKGVLLSRYADLLKNWMIDEREHAHISYPWEPRIDEWVGIEVPPVSTLGQWERQSLPLYVSPPYRELFDDFRRYFEREMDRIHDNDLRQELDILDRLAEFD